MTFYFDSKSELRTSYANQRGLAIRDLGAQTECVHGKTLDTDCFVCRASGTPLIAV